MNIGSGEDISIKTLAEIIADATEYNGSIIWDDTKPDGHPRKQVDISQITKLGWKPIIELTTGIKSTVDYFKERIENNSFLRL
jgi:GDP-L-fucose synthase